MPTTLIFPILSSPPGIEFSEEAVDATIVNDLEGGYQSSRPRHTRDLYKYYVPFHFLNESDKDDLQEFFRQTRRCAASFMWTHPITSTEIECRFAEIGKFVYQGYNAVDLSLWDWDCTLIEV
jgi:phage-related protein